MPRRTPESRDIEILTVPEVQFRNEFVGREDEVACFSRLLEGFPNEPHRFVNLYGLPGIGRTALLERFVKLAREKDFKVVSLRHGSNLGWESVPDSSPLAGDIVIGHQKMIESLQFAPEALNQTLDKQLGGDKAVIFFLDTQQSTLKTELIRARICETTLKNVVSFNVKNPNRLIVWETIFSELLGGELLDVRMREKKIKLGPLTEKETIKQIGREMAGIAWPFSAGYPPANFAIAEACRADTRPDEKCLARAAYEALERHSVWKLVGKTNEVFPSCLKDLVLGLSLLEGKLGVLKLNTFCRDFLAQFDEQYIRLTTRGCLDIIDAIRLLGWDGFNGGYGITEPFKTILSQFSRHCRPFICHFFEKASSLLGE